MTTYNNHNEVFDAGFDIVPPRGRNKSIVVNNKEYQVKDTSGGPNSFGYEFTAYDEGREVAVTHTVWLKGAAQNGTSDGFVVRFRSEDFPA